MAAMLAAGQITRETMAWRPGAAGWAAAGSYAELDGNATAAPPPPPAS
jgi:hypothetical protein